MALPRFSCPPSLVERGYRLVRETADHLPFLRRLFCQYRAAEMSLLPWGIEQKQRFLDQQFSLQYHHFHTAYGDPQHLVLESSDAPVGLVYLAAAQTETGVGLRLVHFMILSEYRGMGLGQALLAGLQALEMPLVLSVQSLNPAARLYRRMGFREAGGDVATITMLWSPTVMTTSLESGHGLPAT